MVWPKRSKDFSETPGADGTGLNFEPWLCLGACSRLIFALFCFTTWSQRLVQYVSTVVLIGHIERKPIELSTHLTILRVLTLFVVQKIALQIGIHFYWKISRIASLHLVPVLRTLLWENRKWKKNSAPGRIQTHNPLIGRSVPNHGATFSSIFKT